MPLVSVLVTCFNREKYLAETLESILASTFEDFEVIVVDDCSTDKTVEIARRFELQDARVRIFKNEKNLGDYPNRNVAASLANGKYLKYVDSDDLIYPWTLEIMVNCIERFPEAAYGMCARGRDPLRPFPFLLTPTEAYERQFFTKDFIGVSPLFTIIKKSFFDELGGFPEKQHVGDFEMWHKLSGLFPMVLMPQGCVWFREHDGQQMKANREDIAISFKYFLLERDLLLSKYNPMPKEKTEQILRLRARQRAGCVIQTAFRKGPAKARQLMKMDNLTLFDIFYEVFKKKILRIE